jgi:hypothetical protein
MQAAAAVQAGTLLERALALGASGFTVEQSQS